MNVNSSLNNMTNMTIAYHVVGNTQKATVIEDNKLQTTQTSVELLLNDGANQTIVQRNHITFGTTAVAPQAVGILAAELNGPNPHSRIHNNEIFFAAGATNAYAGIHVNAVNQYQVTTNKIYMADNTLNQYGIYATDCDNTETSCNEIYGAGAYPTKEQSGIAINMSNNAIIACNTIDHTENGLYIIFTVPNADIKGNVFSNHVNAWHYGKNSISNAQKDKGNEWLIQAAQSNGNGIGYHAYSESNLIPPFEYNDQLNPNVRPPTFWPPNWWTPSTNIYQFKCDDTILDYCSLFNTLPINLQSNLDKAIAAGNIQNPPYTSETRWMLDKELFYKIDDNAAMLQDTVFANYYLAKQNS